MLPVLLNKTLKPKHILTLHLLCGVSVRPFVNLSDVVISLGAFQSMLKIAQQYPPLVNMLQKHIHIYIYIHTHTYIYIYIYGYMASDIWLRTIMIVRKETHCRHIGYCYRLTARVLLYAPSHRQDNTPRPLLHQSWSTGWNEK